MRRRGWLQIPIPFVDALDETTWMASDSDTICGFRS